MLCTPGSQAPPAQWQDPDARNEHDGRRGQETGADGRFEFMLQVETFTIVACRT